MADRHQDHRQHEPGGGPGRERVRREHRHRVRPENLTEVTGIGSATANAIVAYRALNGPFESLAQLTVVSGVTAAQVSDGMVSDPGESNSVIGLPGAREVRVFGSVAALKAALPAPSAAGTWAGQPVRIQRAVALNANDYETTPARGRRAGLNGPVQSSSKSGGSMPWSASPSFGSSATRQSLAGSQGQAGGASGTGSAGSPRCRRILRTTTGSVMRGPVSDPKARKGRGSGGRASDGTSDRRGRGPALESCTWDRRGRRRRARAGAEPPNRAVVVGRRRAGSGAEGVWRPRPAAGRACPRP
ncbi:MAG: helix-hairpin-helix domain-containing protein, partial [Deltaproteobacteria bacterium]|nr:helix-hairpin-helix domain-containing protein [Deltaproteobacteria bacterium]